MKGLGVFHLRRKLPILIQSVELLNSRVLISGNNLVWRALLYKVNNKYVLGIKETKF